MTILKKVTIICIIIILIAIGITLYIANNGGGLWAR